MHPERQAFVSALEANPEDDVTRLIYADWLMDHDQPEEAERMRQWRQAWDWLTRFAGECGENCTNYDEACDEAFRAHREGREPEVEYVRVPIARADLIRAGHDALASDDDYHDAVFVQHGSELARDLMSDEETRKAYWRNWSIVTGVPVPEATVDNRVFDCAC